SGMAMARIHPLSPGIWLMRRLRLRAKLLLLATASVLPPLALWLLGGHAGWVAVAGLVLQTYLMLAFYTSFQHDFRQVLEATAQTASGNLRSTSVTQGHDELADLARLLNRTTSQLSAMVAEVRSNSALVAHAGKSLAAGNRDLA